jgi:hypothetical protein
MFDISVEEPIRLHEAARIAGTGKRGRPIHPSTVFRWIWDGVRGPGGELVRLEGLRIGKHWATSKQALQRFFEELTPEVAGRSKGHPRSQTRRQKAADRAGRQLARAGI